MKWAGMSPADKISQMRAEMKEAGADALAVTMLDEVAWLLNLRGSDVPYNPVFLSYVIITDSEAMLFIDADKVDEQFPNIWQRPIITSQSGQGCQKCGELEGHKEAHLRDGVALTKFLCWLEKTIASGKTLTEVEIDEHLTGYRAAQEGFIEPSFPTIAGAGPNGAIIHYRAQPGTCKTVDANTLLLVDSGGQYDCGTTDITRTMHFGTPTEHQKACFTAVLQGHIQLDEVVYPEGTPGCALDTLARSPLWRMGLNYRHGTGHGVGAALNVHEGPQSISHRFGNTQPLLPGMVCSNEPGYYEDGAFGIRIENLFVIVEAPTTFRFAGQSYYGSSRLTMCPIQKKMMNKEMMSPSEIEWVNTYHQQVYQALAPRLEAENASEELEWLAQATSPL
eukprot:jgi/Picre1/32950/NNA_008277.t1